MRREVPVRFREGVRYEGRKGYAVDNRVVPCCMRDESRSLGLGLQDLIPNHRMRLRSNDRGRERSGKARLTVGQMGFTEANANEPLMRCRKESNAIETRTLPRPWDKIWRVPVYRPDGDRHRGGANVDWARMWNVGTCTSMRTETLQVVNPRGEK